MLNLWSLFQGGGMGGSGYLPDDVLDQPTIMLDCFNIMSAYQDSLDNKDSDLLDLDGKVLYLAADRKMMESFGV